ncbi:MAG: hypothetical protein LBV74_02745 [Tannerella sp.]|jgi:hypothetical protein|nr:hypothetical protein [Tannerella sp.]
MSYEDIMLVKDSLLNKSMVTEEFTLSGRQINRLTDIMYNYNYSKKTKVIIQSHSICGCLHMQHAILFISGNKVIAHILVDFIETNVEPNFPDDNIGVFCKGKYELLKAFFKKVGMKQFDNKIDEGRCINIKTLVEK